MNDDGILRELAMYKLVQPQPQMRRSQKLRSSTKAALMAPESLPSADGYAKRESSLAKMEAVLSGYRELKELRQRARTALQSAADKHEAFGDDRAGPSWRHCELIPSAGDRSLRFKPDLTASGLLCWPGCEEVEELRAQVQDLDRRCAEQLPAVRVVAARLQELQAMP